MQSFYVKTVIADVTFDYLDTFQLLLVESEIWSQGRDREPETRPRMSVLRGETDEGGAGVCSLESDTLDVTSALLDPDTCP